MGGFEMVTQLLSGGAPQPPILFASGHSKLTEVDAQKIGAVGLIYKPFSKEMLIQTMLRILTESQPDKASSI